MKGISGRAMRELASVNCAFVGVATMGEIKNCSQLRFGLEEETVGRLRLLDEAARRRLGYRPFSLFTLRFQDVPAWDAVLERRVRDGDPVFAWPDNGSRLHQFLLMALAAFRELAEREPLSASVLFGAPPALVTQMTRVDISALPGIAKTVKPWLSARCATERDWWRWMILKSCVETDECPDRHRGVHASLMRALNLDKARLRGGRLCRRI
jgi:hypothetical protein